MTKREKTDTEPVLSVRVDDELAADLEAAARATGIRNRSDLVRHAIKRIVRESEARS